MKRRIIAASVAIVVAVVSAMLLLSYVAGADRRAMAGMTTQQVLVVTAPVPEGTTADQLGELVAVRELPAKTIADGAVSRLAELAGRVANTDLQPGEQVLGSRFSDPAALQKSSDVTIPEGFSELSLQLEPQRVVGSNLAPGDKVGVFVSVGDDAKEGRTHLTLHQALVTRVQGLTAAQAAQTSEGNDASAAAKPVPEGSLLVTLAVSAENAEQLVFAAEYGHIWMSLENDASTNEDVRIVTEKSAQQ